jgi:pSer/pThr/pTyr-binding forkhead associated (FHA) protein
LCAVCAPTGGYQNHDAFWDGPLMKLTFQVLEGVDRGRVFRELPAPVTIGREEGNLLRLNDERVSRFHAKVQMDSDDIILTDLESTNGTRVNGRMVQIRRLRAGDRICVGRSLLLYGSNEEIAARMATLANKTKLQASGQESPLAPVAPTIQAHANVAQFEPEADFDLNVKEDVTVDSSGLFVHNHQLPPLPMKLSPSQAARIAEILDLLHRGLTRATDRIEANEEGTEVNLSYADWQKVLGVHMLLALYLRAVTEPDALSQ